MRAVCHRISRSVTENSQEGFYMFRRTLLAFLAIFATGLIMTSPVEAGSGYSGAKNRNGTIRVLGAQTNPITTIGTLTEPAPTTAVGVITFPISLTPIYTYKSIYEFQVAGGQIVNPGQVVVFRVGGPGAALVCIVEEEGLFASGAAGYSGAQNETGYLKITGPSSDPQINGTGDKF
jgi:hypothetical protein